MDRGYGAGGGDARGNRFGGSDQRGYRDRGGSFDNRDPYAPHTYVRPMGNKFNDGYGGAPSGGGGDAYGSGSTYSRPSSNYERPPLAPASGGDASGVGYGGTSD